MPRLREKPKLVVGVIDEDNDCCDPGPHELLDVYGFGPHYVSSAAKALLSGIDPDGFDFVECETTDRHGVSLAPYWMMDAIRVVEYHTAFVVDGVLVDAWRKAGLTGARFTPLQPPTEEEFGAAKEYPDYLSFRNYPYWQPTT